MPGRKKAARIALPPPRELDRCVATALAEDFGEGKAGGDLTSSLAIPSSLAVEARIVSRENGVLAGGPVAERVFRAVDPRIRVRLPRRDGASIRRGDCVLVAKGSARSLLAAERSALNFLQHLSGIATETARVVRAARGHGVRVLATRKTVPGMRALQKYAVQTGGGSPHRQGLFDAVLLKENHFDLAGSRPDELLRAVRARAGASATIGAEARNRKEAMQALDGGADWILLDNMKPSTLRTVARALRARAKKLGRSVELEASGGIRRGNARAYARSGVDRISLGSLTHSVRALDFSMDFVPLAARGRR